MAIMKDCPDRLPQKKSAPHEGFKFGPHSLQIGVELEGGWQGGWQQAWDAAKSVPELDIFPERDGNFDLPRGDECVECVVHPVARREIIKKGGAWNKFMNEAKKRGFYTGPKTGMHINVNCPDDGQRHRACWMLNRFSNLGMVIGRRGATYNPYHKDRNYTYAGQNGMRFGKYSSGADRGNRVEVRLHKSTCDFNEFVTSINYSAAIVEFAMERATAPTEKEFVLWCLSKPKYVAFLKYAAENLLKADANERADLERAKVNCRELFEEVGLIG